MRGIPFIQLLREKTSLSLKRAKEIKEKIVDNEEIVLDIPHYELANEIAKEASKLGVICEARE